MAGHTETYIIGVDEVGRGPIAGPVTVGAVALPINYDTILFEGARDSKKLSPKKREDFYDVLEREKGKGNLHYSVNSVSSDVIDSEGIVPAIRSALNSALSSLKLDPRKCEVLLDGNLFAPAVYAIPISERSLVEMTKKFL